MLWLLAARKAFPGDAPIGAKRIFECAFHDGVPIAEQKAVLLFALGKNPLDVDGVPVNRHGGGDSLIGRGGFPRSRKGNGHFMILVVLVVVERPKPGPAESGQGSVCFFLVLPRGDDRTLCKENFIGLVL